MSFDATKIALMAHPEQFVGENWYAYYTSDTFATVRGDDYFKDYAENLSINDKIMVWASDGWGMVRIKAVSPQVATDPKYLSALA